MIYFELDCAALTGREDLHSKLAEGLRLPVWYGRNLDALFDCLTEPGEELTLRLLNTEWLDKRLGDYAQRLIRTLEDATGSRFHLDLTDGL